MPHRAPSTHYRLPPVTTFACPTPAAPPTAHTAAPFTPARALPTAHAYAPCRAVAAAAAYLSARMVMPLAVVHLFYRTRHYRVRTPARSSFPHHTHALHHTARAYFMPRCHLRDSNVVPCQKKRKEHMRTQKDTHLPPTCLLRPGSHRPPGTSCGQWHGRATRGRQGGNGRRRAKRINRQQGHGTLPPRACAAAACMPARSRIFRMRRAPRGMPLHGACIAPLCFTRRTRGAPAAYAVTHACRQHLHLSTCSSVHGSFWRAWREGEGRSRHLRTLLRVAAF